MFFISKEIQRERASLSASPSTRHVLLDVAAAYDVYTANWFRRWRIRQFDRPVEHSVAA